MVLLKTELNKEDYEYFSTLLNMLVAQRDLKNRHTTNKGNEKNTQEKNYDKFIMPLAENGQIEAMQYYCENLPPVSTLNSKVVVNIKKIEAKPIKSPRELMALFAYYNWYVDYYKYSYKSLDLESKEEYQKAKNYYNQAYQDLYRKKDTDPIANVHAFLLDKRNKNKYPQEQYARILSNFRNQLYSSANHQINKDMRSKLFLEYGINVTKYASDTEYTNRRPLILNIIASLQKERILMDELGK